MRREEIASHIEANDVVARARSHAARILRAARAARVEARRYADAFVEAAHQEAQLRSAEAAEAAAREAAASAVRWAVDANRLEDEIAMRVHEQCCGLVGNLVGQFAGEADRGALIASRVTAELAQLKDKRALVLWVAPPDARAVGYAVKDACPEAISLRTDPALNSGTARLESPYLYATLDLDTHLRCLLDTLTGTQRQS